MSLSQETARGGRFQPPPLTPLKDRFERLARSPSASIRVPGRPPMRLATDRVRAAPALTPTLSGSLGMGAMGLGWWGLLAPRSVSKFLGLRAGPATIMTLFGLRELYTGYTLAGDPTRSDTLWMRVVGDLFDLAVLRSADSPSNPQADNARLAFKAVALITVLDVVAAVRMGAVQRNCKPEGRR